MNPDLQAQLDNRLSELIDEASSLDVNSPEFAAAATNLASFSKVRTLLPEPRPEPAPVPKTRWEKIKAELAPMLNSDIMQKIVPALASVGGVGLVVWSTIHKDHVLDKQATAQANQRIN